MADKTMSELFADWLQENTIEEMLATTDKESQQLLRTLLFTAWLGGAAEIGSTIAEKGPSVLPALLIQLNAALDGLEAEIADADA